MTMVIITGGIDLSVGSLVSLSAVTAAVLISSIGGVSATPMEMLLCSLAAIAVCAAVGGFSGTMVTLFKIPPFVATLAMMWVAGGLAFIVSDGETISDLPKSYKWLGMGTTVPPIPDALLLTVIVFAVGHFIMSRTTLGRHIYAIGRNRQAARPFGIHVNRTLLIVYTISGVMAGLAGVLLASQFTVPPIPNALLLMVIVFAVGHFTMSRTTLGRHIYAIGGNRQAARLSGIHVNRTLLIVYTISGAMAGLAGVLLASQFTSGAPRYGQMYELYAIAAVVVGGTSLAGGEGKILGTLIGVLTIAVVQTAMNLLAIKSDWQDVTLGLIVLLVVLLDNLKRHGWRQLLTSE
ncbi:MAG: hypothetical protein HQ567_00330 [Candidatus Nealsonbacteria bacterium]|nr:hypothetical protein [Candidatus Nealsonbacteria bacterium]